MKNISNYLIEQDVNVDALPSKIQTSIRNSEKLYNELLAYAKEIEEEGSEEEKEAYLNEEARLQSYNENLINKIESWIAAEEEKAAKAKEEAKAKAEAEKAQAEKEKAPEVVAAEPIVEEPKKKGIGLGTFILGAAVLIATAGAVNLMRNKNG